LRDSDEVLTRELTPVEFFDPIGKGESFENDAIPRFNHARDYLTERKEMINWTDLLVEDGTTSRITTTFLHDPDSWVAFRREDVGYQELIHTVQIGKDVCYILRMHHMEGNEWTINYSALITTLPDGSEQEIRFDTNPSEPHK